MAQIVDQRLPAAGYNALNARAGTGEGHTCYASNAAAGKAMLLSATTGNQPTLWNPSTSGVNAILRSITLQWLSGTVTTGSFLWCLTTGAGDAIYTGGPIVTFTDITAGTRANASGAFASVAGSLYTPKCRWAPTVNTFTTAPPYAYPVGLAGGAFAQATTDFQNTTRIEIGGEIVLVPGEALTLAYSVTTSTALFNVKLVYDEVTI